LNGLPLKEITNPFMASVSEWLIEKDMVAEFETLDVTHLADLLRRFYGEVRTMKGQKYSNQSMNSIRSAIHRHLTSPPHNLPINIMGGPRFQSANQVLEGQRKILRVEGLDIRDHHDPIAPEDVCRMYTSGCLSTLKPESLLYKSFFELVLHFGRRGREGLRLLDKTSLKFDKSACGKECVTLAYRELEKNHTGLKPKETERQQMMFATGGPNCPVASLKLYISKLHPECNALFQRPRPKGKWALTDKTWYVQAPVGKNYLGNFMKQISKNAALSKPYTNHCIRATCVTVLAESGVHPNDICAVTGHANVTSLQHYSRGPSVSQRAEYSGILANYCHSNEDPTLSSAEHSDENTVAIPVSVAMEPVSSSQTSILNVNLHQQKMAQNSGALFYGANLTNCTININYSG
jgi:hypothetical protein